MVGLWTRNAQEGFQNGLEPCSRVERFEIRGLRSGLELGYLRV